MEDRGFSPVCNRPISIKDYCESDGPCLAPICSFVTRRIAFFFAVGVLLASFEPGALAKAPLRGTTYGPNTVPHNFIVSGGQGQPPVLFDKTDPSLTRCVIDTAASLKRDRELGPWQKIGRIQACIRGQVTHAGNDTVVTSNPNPYTRFNADKSRTSSYARLGDYLRLGKVACREMAFLTEVGLEAAGFDSRLVAGQVYKNGAFYAGHTWNEVKLDGAWRVVDTTNPQYNGYDREVVHTRGTPNGWVWKTLDDKFCIFPASSWQTRRLFFWGQ